MSRKSATFSPPAPSAVDDHLLIFDQADEFLDGRSMPSLDNVDLKVKEAQEQLLHLRLQQEEVERQKQHLEVLRKKQERFTTGKRDLTDKLSRSVATLERELYDAQKLVEELSLTKEVFNRHLETLRGLQPEKWHRSHVDEELDRALVAIDDAEDEYAKGTRRVATVRATEAVSLECDNMPGGAGGFGASWASDDAGDWMRRGFAFTLPLMGAIFFALVLAKLMF